MAKIDVTKIEGYENMTLEEKVAALEAHEYDDGAEEIERQKKAVTKANGEAAQYKRELEKVQKAGRADKTAADEQLETLRGEIESLKKEKTVANHKAKLLAQGYDDALAEETAQALADGDTDKVFANQKKFLDGHDNALRAELMKGTPRPGTGNWNGKSLTREDIMKIQDPSERQAAIAANLDLFGKGE